MRPLKNGKPWRTSGNQKWQGASPSLKARAILSRISETSFKGSKIDQDPVSQAFIRAPLRSRAALRAWTKKYFIAASIFRGVNFAHKIGISAKVLNSRPTQIKNSFSEERTITVPNTKEKKRKNEIVRCIELEGSLTLNNLIIS